MLLLSACRRGEDSDTPPPNGSGGTRTASVALYFCPCNNTTYSDLQECISNCHVSLACFVGICAPLYLPGESPNQKEKNFQDLYFPNLKTYSVLRHADPKFNCIAYTIDIYDKWIWNEVDSYYGNNNKILEVEDFDALYALAGYQEALSCSLESGYKKIALYGKINPDGSVEPTHAARQATQQPGGGEWWESKEGNAKTIFHQLQELTGTTLTGNEMYGEVIKCYEKISE